MNRYLLLGIFTVAFLSFNTLSMAQNNNSDNETEIMTVSQIGNLDDDTMVTLQGTLNQNPNTYIFTDNTGNINAIIESGDWNDTSFNPNAVVLVTGKVNKNGNISEIDVTEIQNAQ